MQIDTDRLLRYDRWANLRVLESLQACANPPARAMEIFSHIIAAHSLFISRVRQEKPGEVWPRGDNFTAMEREIQLTYDTWQAILSTTPPQTEIEYVNSKGERWRSRLHDIITHLVIHSGYHRGQIALLIGSVGGTPAYTDFIQASRSGTI